MVTYFPVPYVAYSKINASKQLDIGLTSACEMNLGCSESGALGIRPLQATEVNLNRGKLDLNTASAVKSTNVTLGSGSGEANIDFATNLRIGTLNNGYSLEAADMTVDELKLFASHMRTGGEKFPSCAATGASGAPQISWQKIKLKNAEEVYLMCGTPKETNPDPETRSCSATNTTLECSEKITRDKYQDHWGYMQEYYLLTRTTNDPGFVDPPCYGRVTCNFEIEDLSSYDGCDMQEGANIDRTKPYTCDYCYYNDIGSCTDGAAAQEYPYCYEVYTGTMTLTFTQSADTDTWECPYEKQCGSSYGQCL